MRGIVRAAMVAALVLGVLTATAGGASATGAVSCGGGNYGWI